MSKDGRQRQKLRGQMGWKKGIRRCKWHTTTEDEDR